MLPLSLSRVNVITLCVCFIKHAVMQGPMPKVWALIHSALQIQTEHEDKCFVFSVPFPANLPPLTLPQCQRHFHAHPFQSVFFERIDYISHWVSSAPVVNGRHKCVHSISRQCDVENGGPAFRALFMMMTLRWVHLRNDPNNVSL